jgi:transcription antitermination factor NusG
MSKDKGKSKAISKGDNVNITAGKHADKRGKVLHIRALTGEAHIELADSGAVVNVQVSTLEAA